MEKESNVKKSDVGTKQVIEKKSNVKKSDVGTKQVIEKKSNVKKSDVGTKQVTELDILNNNIILVNAGLKSIVRGFYSVSKVLSELKANELYKTKGYDNFFDFTKTEFNLSKTQSSNLVNIYNKFPSSKYSDFTFSQLSEMLSLPSDKVDEISSDMTIKQIREVKKKYKGDKIIKKKGNDNVGEIYSQIDVSDVIPVVIENKDNNSTKSVYDIEQLESVNKILKNRKVALELKNEKISNINREMLKEINNLKGRLELAKSSYDNVIKRDNEKISKLEKENDNLKKEAEKLKKEKDRLKKEKDRLKKENEKLKTELVKLDKDISK